MVKQSLEKERFIVLIAKHERRVRGFLSAVLCMNQGDIDDAMQSALVVAWEKLPLFEYRDPTPDEEFVRWLCTIAKNQARAVIRGRSRIRTFSFTDEVFERIVNMHSKEEAYLEARHQALVVCLSKLPKDDRGVLELKYAGGKSIREIAAVVCKTEGALRAHISRLRRRLEHCIKRAIRGGGRCHGT